ncbi:MAG: PASTA domain-containing protein [Bacteroidales bacterium]|nr:PASTA domain-containing protein [Bacteroidales bacterium]
MWKHIAIQLSIVIILLIAVYFLLSVYTYHGEAIETPNFTGLTLEQAEQTAQAYNLKVVLSDSVHFIDKPKGTVVSQTPEPKHKIKPHRTIYLIINGFENEKVAMPDLRGISLRQAYADAELFGLKIGKLTYVPDISTTVIEQLYKGKPIKPQTKIAKGSVIDLIIGKGEQNEKTSVICLIGKTLQEAKDLLSAASLNIGTIIADKTVITSADSANALIWKQSPSCKNQTPVSLGSYVDVWITKDKDLLPDNEINL